MAETYNLIFLPEVREGRDEDEVKKKLIATLNVEREKVDGWFESGKPTILLKEIDEETAEKYMRAIMKCGAKCSVQSSDAEDGGLALVPKQFRTTQIFICPSCEHEEDVDEPLEQCPKCGLVIAKWQEQMAEEKAKEEIRRRRLREERLRADDAEEAKRKKAELERVRRRERELMTELGMKPPGKFWLFFEKYPLSVGTAMSAVIVMVTMVTLYYVDQWLERQEFEALVAAEPSAEIKQVAPVMADAVSLGQTGNQRVLIEVADVMRFMHRTLGVEHQQIVNAAQQMMKGAGNEAFIDAALKMPNLATRAKPAQDEAEGAPVNLDTIGGISGLTGVERFAPETLKAMAPPLLEHGHEEVLNVMAEKRMVADPQDPEGPAMIVDAIDRLDGSMIVDLLETLDKDQEWDQFLLGHVNRLLKAGDVDEASELANRIRNPVMRVQALGDIMANILNSGGGDIDLKIYAARVDIEIRRIGNADIRAMALLELGRKLSEAGSETQPGEAIGQVRTMLQESPEAYEKAFLASRLAIAQLNDGNQAAARQFFDRSLNFAAQVNSDVDRISAFTRIARRYYDARNTTLASEILSEAVILAATRLPPAERARVIGEVAMARGYMGDFNGAIMSIDNAGSGEARQQLLSKLAESLIGQDKPWLAQSVMTRIDDHVEYNRLELRLISAFLHDGHLQEARDRLVRVQDRVRRIESLSERGLILSQYGRLFARAGQPERAMEFFEEAVEISSQLEGRKRSVNKGLVALDQARALMIGPARQLIAEVPEAIVKDPIDSQILNIERVVEGFL